MYKKNFSIFIFCCFLFSSTLQAKTTAKIKQILLVESSLLVYVYPEGGVQNPLACHGSNGDYISFKMSRPMAKEYLSVLMVAFIAKKTVSFTTASDCIDQSVSETLQYFVVY